MQGIYNYIPHTNHVSRVYSVAAVLYLQFVLHVMIFRPWNVFCTYTLVGTAVAQWLRYYATNRKVAGSIPAGVNEIFHWHKILPIALWPWGRLSLQQKWVAEVFPGGKGGRCVRLTTYHYPVPLSWNLGTLISWNPLGHSRPVTGLLYLLLIH